MFVVLPVTSVFHKVFKQHFILCQSMVHQYANLYSDEKSIHSFPYRQVSLTMAFAAPSFTLSVSVSVCLSLSLSFCLFVGGLSVSLFKSLSLYNEVLSYFICLSSSVCLFYPLSVSLFISVSVCCSHTV